MTPRLFALYISGQIGIMLLARFFFQWIILFSTSEHTLPDGSQEVLFSASAVGFVLLLFRLFDAVSDPLAGILSDYCVRRGWERRRLLLFSFLVPGIGLALCFIPSLAISSNLRWTYLVAGMFVFFVGYTFYAIPYWSLIDDYSAGNSHCRRMLSNLLGAGLLIATALVFIISPILVDKLGFKNSAILTSLLASLLMILPYFAQPKSLAAIAAADPNEAQDSAPFSTFIATFKHKRFVSILSVFTGSQVSLTIMTAAAPFIALELLGGSKKDVAFLMGPLLALAIPCFFFIPGLSFRFGWEKVVLSAALLLGIVYALTGFLGASVVGSPLLTASLLFGLAGPMIAALLGLEGEAITVCAREKGDKMVSTYFGSYNLAVKGFNGLGIFAAGILADLSRGSLGKSAIRAMPIIAGCCLLTGFLLNRYLQRSPKKELAD